MLLYPLIILLSIKCVTGAEERITNTNSFSSFISNVNSGTSYIGTTVYLDSDISLSGNTLDSIGYFSNSHFRGVFDGQGYVISDLTMGSSSMYTGLFGYSTGMTVRNVILDSSCAITSSYKGSSFVFTGGIVGHCYGRNSQCNIENCVNMANVSFSGTISSIDYYLYLGGIVGCLQSSTFDNYVKNCANYGHIVYSGTNYNSIIGGIVGYLLGSDKYQYLNNCLNYGTITHEGTSSNMLYMGGIAGFAYYTTIENCVSDGNIYSTKSYNIGSLVGCFNDNAYLYHCYYTDKLNSYNKYGYDNPAGSSNILKYNSTTFKLSEVTSIGTYIGDSLIDALNSYADYNIQEDYSHWLLNKNSDTITFNINSRSSSIKMNYQISILPSLAPDGSLSFDGWYSDSQLTTLFIEPEVSNAIALYGFFGENIDYTITFDTKGGPTVSSQTHKYGDTVTLPSDLTKDYCFIVFWENYRGYNVGFSFTMPEHNVTLYAVWKCTNIKAADDFIDFTKIVNSGSSNYSETTVYIESDLTLSGYIINQIGHPNYHFCGVFDGQGYVISNVTIGTPTYPKYIGLFGYSIGMTVKNVILDSSCTIKSSYSSSHAYVGGIIGYCNAVNSNCNIENCVNMGNVIFSGTTTDNNLFIGGIAGYLKSPSSNYNAIVKNCANYGSIVHSGTCAVWVEIGGIAGFSQGYSSNHNSIQNCLNHGTITHSGTSKYPTLGGIVGNGNSWTHIENCLSAGQIGIPETSQFETNYTGSVVGYIDSGEVHINYCYYIDNVGISSITGYGTPITSNTSNYSTAVGSGLTSDLNDQAASNRWNGWLLNSNRAPVVFKVNNRTGFTISAQIILLPNIAEAGSNVFRGWFADSTYSYFTPQSVSSATTLYGLYGVVVSVSFNGTGGTPSQGVKYILCGSEYGTLATATRAGYTFIGWYTEDEEGVTESTTMSSTSSHTLYAHWTANNYTVIFDKNGGETNDMDSKNVTYDSEYGTLATVTRTGYTFVGWFTEVDGNIQITDTTKVTITDTQTLYAHWTANNYTVIFDKNGGETNDMDSKNVTYDGEYGTLATVTRTGYTFAGWFTEANSGSLITDTTKVTITDTQTLYAHWEEIVIQVSSSSSKTETPTSQVEITFNTKDLSKEDVASVIKQHTNEKFTIVKFEDTSDGIRVIVKFNDPVKAEEFVRTVRSTSDPRTRSIVKRIDYNSKDISSYSSSLLLYPFLFFAIVAFAF